MHQLPIKEFVVFIAPKARRGCYKRRVLDKTGVNSMKLLIVGVGMGNLETMTRQAEKAVEQSDCLIGSPRLLESFSTSGKELFEAYSAQKIADYLARHPAYQRVCVLMSGDVGFYSGAKAICELLTQPPLSAEVECIPGVSSVQYLCAKLCMPWEDAKLVSLHGREQNLVAAVAGSAKTFLLTGGRQSVGEICEELAQSGFGGVTMHVGQNLSYPNEQIVSGTAAQLAGRPFEPLAVVLVQNPAPKQRPVTHGLSDGAFLRGEAPMTKREVRTVAISALNLTKGSIVWDVGAGTGSVGIEIARILQGGAVYAVEKQPAALTLLHENKHRFSAYNLHIVQGAAPAALAELPTPDAVFVGGSSGGLLQIVELALLKNPAVRVVVTAITLETVGAALECFAHFDLCNQDVVQLAVSRSKPAGGYHMMMGQNPVYILSGGGGGNVW